MSDEIYKQVREVQAKELLKRYSEQADKDYNEIKRLKEKCKILYNDCVYKADELKKKTQRIKELEEGLVNVRRMLSNVDEITATKIELSIRQKTEVIKSKQETLIEKIKTFFSLHQIYMDSFSSAHKTRMMAKKKEILKYINQ